MDNIKKNFESKMSDFIFDDERFIKCKIDVCHDGLNKNNSRIDADTILRCANESIRCIPILAHVYKDSETGEWEVGAHDFDLEHGENGLEYVYYEKPVGFVTPDSSIEMVGSEDGRKHLVVEGVIWKNYSEQLVNYIHDNGDKLDTSMEINCTDYSFMEDNTISIKDFVFDGISCLGKQHTPAMVNSCIQFSLDEIKHELQEMIKQYSDMKGGENVEKENIVEEVVEQIENNEVVEETEEVTEEVVEQVENNEVAENQEVEDEFKKKKCEEDEEEKDEDDDYKCKKRCEEEYEALKVQHEEIKSQYESLQAEYEKLKGEFESLKGQYSELKAFKDAHDKVEYEKTVDEITNKFSIDNPELKEKVLNKEISLEQYEEKLGLQVALNE